MVLFFAISTKLLAQNTTVNSQSKPIQKFPLVSTEYYSLSGSDFETKLGAGKNKLNGVRTTLQLAVPTKNEKLYLMNRLQYTNRSSTTSVQSLPVSSNGDYQSVMYALGLIKVLPKSWILYMEVAPTIASDFKQPVQSDDWLLLMSAMATKRSSINTEFGFGLAYTSMFGNLMIVPLFTLNHRSANWLFTGVLPSSIAQYYLLNEDNRIGLKLAFYGNLYNISGAAKDSGFDLNRVSYSSITLGPEAQFKVWGDLYFTTSAGVSFHNKIESQDDNFKKELSINLDNKLFVNFGMRVLL